MKPTRARVGARSVTQRITRPVGKVTYNHTIALETTFAVSATLTRTALTTTLGRDSVEVYCTHFPLRLD